MIGKEDKSKDTRLKNALQDIRKKATIIATLVFIIIDIVTVVLQIYFGSAFDIKTLETILIITVVISTIIFSFVIGVIFIIFKRTEYVPQDEVQNNINDKLKCQECMSDMLDIQKHLYGKDIEEFLHEMSVEDIHKIKALADALREDDETISDDEIDKLRKFFDVLLKAKQAGKYASYISIEDMKVIESNVDSSGTIIVISSSVSCDEELQPIIIKNLINGIKYRYYFPKKTGVSAGGDESFRVLVEQFNKNLSEWQRESKISFENIKEQVSCAYFPDALMQMSLTAYNFHRGSIEGQSPEIIVKFPALDANVSKEYPLFYYVNKRNGVNNKLCDSINIISDESKPLNIVKMDSGLAQFLY